MINPISLKKNTIANYIGQFYTMFIGIFMLPFYLEYLGAEAYGLVAFFTILVSIMMLFDMGFSQALVREVARLKDNDNGFWELKKILRSVEAFIFIVASFLFCLVYVNSEFISSIWLKVKYLDKQLVIECIKLMGFMMGLRWFVSLYNGFIIGFEKQVWLSIYKIIMITLKSVGGIIFVIYISDSILYYFLYQTVIAMIELIVIAVKVYTILPSTKFLIPSLANLKTIAPFALTLAYTSGIWIVYSQADKFLLSHYISLNEYGFFALVTAISNAVMQFSAPLGQALVPRMTSLFSNNRIDELINLYRKSTQFMAIIMVALVTIVSLYSYELLYAWSGNKEASNWAYNILSYYTLGSGLLVMSAFQYDLQYAYGNLSYHVKYNSVFPLIALPITYIAIINFEAIGAAIAWFVLNLISFIIWPYLVHKKFANHIKNIWLTRDILPSIIMSSLFMLILKMIDINFTNFTRIEIFLVLIVFGILNILLNAVPYLFLRNSLFNFRKSS